MFIFGCYLPPESDIDLYKENLILLESLYLHYSSIAYIVYAGDFNASCLKCDEGKTNRVKSNLLKSFVNEYSLQFLNKDNLKEEI